MWWDTELRRSELSCPEDALVKPLGLAENISFGVHDCTTLSEKRSANVS